MYRTLEREISLFIAQTIGKHHIIFSYNEKSHYLIQDLCANNERVIVVDEKFTPEIQNMLEAMKVIVIQSDRKSTRLNSSHVAISYAVFCSKKKQETRR